MHFIPLCQSRLHWARDTINSLRPRPNRRHFADDIFKCIFENENEWISPRISLKFVPKVQINNIPALVQIMAWRRPGDKPLSEPMTVILSTHICVTRPQWVKMFETCSLHGYQWTTLYQTPPVYFGNDVSIFTVRGTQYCLLFYLILLLLTLFIVSHLV